MKKQDIATRISNIIESFGEDSKQDLKALTELHEKLTSSNEKTTRTAWFVTINEVDWDSIEADQKVPKQMRICHELLINEFNSETTLEIKGIREFFADKVEELGTKQDPYRIYAYYQKPLAECGAITREKTEVAK